MKTATKSYKFHSDPGHGWLQVPRSEIGKLGIEDEISSYSYQCRDSVYLEEDCDLYRFVKAYERKYGEKPEIEEMKQVNCDSHVRGYASYSKR